MTRVVLISPYELGRQPFGLAQPAAWLREEGSEVSCLDLSIQRLDPMVLGQADLVAIHVPMHTATRIAVEALPRIREMAGTAELCVYGLYAPMNEPMFRSLGVGTVLGGEVEQGLVSLLWRIRRGDVKRQIEPLISLAKLPFKVPDRSGLPALGRYASLVLPDGRRKIAGFAEASRGCKYLCRHCPVVPVYEGRFRVVPIDVVLADIGQQVAVGAEHISFGDPDFLNGPTHARRLVRALHREHPGLSYDVTIKIEHIVKYPELMRELKDTGCLFVTTAAEAVDDDVLARLDKGHTHEDFGRAVSLCRQIGLHLAPTFVAFTPWTTCEGYVRLLRRLSELELVESVPPVQLAIRLLVPEGSYLLRLPGFSDLVEAFDPDMLGYPWRNPDPRVDRLQEDIMARVAQAEADGWSRSRIFAQVWSMAHAAMGMSAAGLPAGNFGKPVPHLSEAWYCCAEPTGQQLQAF
jgi:radical SAM superfamily enzyme YgiQ (UPF0313 family)